MRVFPIKSFIIAALAAGLTTWAATAPASASYYEHCGYGHGWRDVYGVWHGGDTGYYRPWHGDCPGHDHLTTYYGGGSYFGDINGFMAGPSAPWHGAYPGHSYVTPYYGGGSYFGD